MSRRRQASRVTIETLIEAARKVKRPDLKSLRQMRRNGAVPEKEMEELLAEACGVPVDEVRSVSKESLTFLCENFDPQYFDGVRVNGGWHVLTINRGHSLDIFSLMLMNPSCPSLVLEKSLNQYTWRFIVRNPSLFLALMESPEFAWRIVDTACDGIETSYAERRRYEPKNAERFTRWIESSHGDEMDGRNLAYLYASNLNALSHAERSRIDLYETIGDDRPHEATRHRRRLHEDKYTDEDGFYVRPDPKYDFDMEPDREVWSKIPSIHDIQGTMVPWSDRSSRGKEAGLVFERIDWAAHARVINLILPYFEEMAALGAFR